MALYIYDPNIRIATPLSVDLRRRTITELSPVDSIAPIHTRAPSTDLVRQYADEQSRRPLDQAPEQAGGLHLSDIMTPDVVCIPETASWQEARTLLVTYGIHHLIVTDASGKIAGLLVERDLLNYPDGHSIVTTTLPMRTLTAATPDTDIRAVAFVMLERGTEAIAVLDAGTLAGIVTQKDLLKTFFRPGLVEDWA